eukprot:CAMPEP_0179958756 /NCGR_PEP_ID=MMETSP0983-20121128/28200_1 /TAXON_ID=483367 /ORGANISM="non described non described, Strain CCMP 2436" /LENGTH=63 /DNA_ID=CAMNT_0021870907 /DNA_START=858 /DNA_END=1046 /DNA_ORIENTATION=+
MGYFDTASDRDIDTECDSSLPPRRQRHMESGGGGDNVARTSARPAAQRCNFLSGGQAAQAQLK